MKKFIVPVLTIAFLLTGSAAFATKFYNRGSFGLAVADNVHAKDEGQDFGFLTTKCGFFVSEALGIQPTNWLRGEFEVSYQKYDTDNLFKPGGSFESTGYSMSSINFMVNGYIDLYTDSRLTPYFMFGIGQSVNQLGDALEKRNWTGNSFQSGFGFGYAITETTSLDFEYRYSKTSKYTKDKLDIIPGGINNFMIGFRQFF